MFLFILLENHLLSFTHLSDWNLNDFIGSGFVSILKKKNSVPVSILVREYCKFQFRLIPVLTGS